MVVKATPGNFGPVRLTVSARVDGGGHARASRRRSTGKRGKISSFSRKSRARFRHQLDTAAIPPSRSAVITLEFPSAGLKEAKKEYQALIRLAKKRLPGVFGWYSVEFKATGLLHLHVLMCAPANTIAEILALRGAFERKAPSLTYMEKMRSLHGWLGYISKHDHQRNIPLKFAGTMTRFWGGFGKIPSLPSTTILLPEGAQEHVRQAVAHLIAEQSGDRSHGFACAFAASSARISAMLSAAQTDELLRLLRDSAGPQARKAFKRSFRACPARSSPNRTGLRPSRRSRVMWPALRRLLPRAARPSVRCRPLRCCTESTRRLVTRGDLGGNERSVRGPVIPPFGQH